MSKDPADKPTHKLSSPHLDAVRRWKPPPELPRTSTRHRDELEGQLDLLSTTTTEDDTP